MPVEQTVTTVSMSPPARCALANAFSGSIDKQRFGAFEKGLGTFRPAARFKIPVERLHAVTLDDAGIGKNA